MLRRVTRGKVFVSVMGGMFASIAAAADESTRPGLLELRNEIRPLLTQLCYDCHGEGESKGNVAFDAFKSDEELLEKKDLWRAVLRNVRAGLMPPARKPRPTEAEKKRLADWIKLAVFESDPREPDPGRVTLRRLNRTEYRNTIRDLMGIDFDTEREFPPDDTGHGFDNIGDVLTLSPMLIEKYLAAAKAIVDKAVPMVARVPPENHIAGNRFLRIGAAVSVEKADEKKKPGPEPLSYYDSATISHTFTTDHAGRYQLLLDLTANERFVDGQFDYNKCRLLFKIDGEELLRREHVREGGKPFHDAFDRDLLVGEHELRIEVEPLTPAEKQVRSLSLKLDAVTVRGPTDERLWVQPKSYERFFLSEAPSEPQARRAHSRNILERFATRAFRRPVDARTVDRLADLAVSVSTKAGKTFEAGIAQAMVAVLASPRFLFREEEVEPIGEGQAFSFVDEYALASRLSYFLWSSMPDEELFRLAGEKKLRSSQSAQIQRMLADSRFEALIRNFTGQWLQVRDIDSVQIDARSVMSRELEPDPELDRAREKFRALRDKPFESLTPEEKADLDRARAVFFKSRGRFSRFELTGALRQAMRQETEKWFEHIVRGDRSLLELLDSDSTFLNQRLAEHYEVPGVEGEEMRLVRLPADSPRGGLLTQGTLLAVTSNPTRTSPVKRGLFILENILGAPPPPPPPDIPPLEDSAKGAQGREPTLRETLALHRDKPLCSSCHNRMDPLGLALENFNALGRWREKERGQPVDVAGKLITGEAFTSIRELKRTLVKDRAQDFYRCLTEKLLIYALGRGLGYSDEATVDQIVERITRENGRPSALFLGIIESAPFQKRRNLEPRENLRAF